MVDALEQSVHVEALGLLRVHDRLVVDSDVEDDVLALWVVAVDGVHPAHTVLHDVGDLVGPRRVVVHDRRVGRGQQRRVTVSVLQPLARQRGAAGGGADQEAACELVGHRPDGVARALEPEHRVEDVERDHHLAVGGVRRARGCRRGHRAGLGDALVEQLARLVLSPLQQQLAVHRLVALAARVVDLGAGEHRVHAERAVLVRRDRDDARPDLLVLHPVPQQPDDGHGGRDLALARALLELGVGLVAGDLQRLGADHPLGQGAAELPTAIHHVLDLGGVLARVEERRRARVVVGLVDVAVAHRQVEPVAELLEVVLLELLHLVGGVLALEGLDRPSLDGVRQDHGRLADVLARGVEGGVHLAVVVAAARQLLDLPVGHVLDHLAQPGVGAEEVLAVVGTVLNGVGLERAVRSAVHLVDEHAVDVAGEKLVPLAAPDHLDDVPARTPEL